LQLCAPGGDGCGGGEVFCPYGGEVGIFCYRGGEGDLGEEEEGADGGEAEDELEDEVSVGVLLFRCL
jgi:hypothetical protein